MTGRVFVVLFSLLVVGRADTLILKDGKHIAGRWWSVDATEVHFLVNNQLQHYARTDVSAVTFGDATLPAPPAPASATPPTAPTPAGTPPPAKTSQAAASAAEPARTPSPATPSISAPKQPPTLGRASAGAPSTTPAHVSQPDEIGMVYFWNGKDLNPLERSRAGERGRGTGQYWEMAGAQSRVRFKEASVLVFVVRLPKGVPPAGYSLFPLLATDGSRRTRPQEGRQGGQVTWPFAIETNDESSYITYGFRVRDLPAGEYSFSPSNSNDGYCFGVDPAPGQ